MNIIADYALGKVPGLTPYLEYQGAKKNSSKKIAHLNMIKDDIQKTAQSGVVSNKNGKVYKISQGHIDSLNKTSDKISDKIVQLEDKTDKYFYKSVVQTTGQLLQPLSDVMLPGSGIALGVIANLAGQATAQEFAFDDLAKDSAKDILYDQVESAMCSIQ